MADNVLSIVVKQTEGDKVLSEVSLVYPTLPNEMANAITFDLLDAVEEVLRGYAIFKAESTGGDQVAIQSLKQGKKSR